MKILTGPSLEEREIQIEREFREPFALVVRGFAEQGESRNSTAEILSIHRPKFRRLLAKHFPEGDPWEAA